LYTISGILLIPNTLVFGCYLSNALQILRRSYVNWTNESAKLIDWTIRLLKIHTYFSRNSGSREFKTQQDHFIQRFRLLYLPWSVWTLILLWKDSVRRKLKKNEKRRVFTYFTRHRDILLKNDSHNGSGS